MFNSGDLIRLYVSDVSSGEQGKSPMVKVSRSDPGYLRRIFEEEVREIYDGTVIIKSLAREAGIRSKIAVYSNDPNIDCVGACIGVNGSAIQRIVAQLGNARDKEKIDIISYSPNDALFIIDALRPASVLKIGLYTNEEGKKCAVAIVPDNQSSLAIGRKGANVRVACKLTGYKIDILEEAHEADATVELKSVEQVQLEEKERAQKEKYENYLAKIKASRAEEAKVSTDTGAVEKAKPQKILDEDLTPEVEEKVEVKPVAEVKVEEKVKTPEVKQTVVKTTTTLASLEASLESDKKKEEFKATQKSSKRPRKITEEEVEHEEVKPVEKKQPQMEIYTKEELEELENEELLEDEYYEDDEELDYDDFDKYYDDEN